MNVIGYVRVSTAGQAKDGYSLAYQQEEIRSYCQTQGWNLIEIYVDEGISGAKVDEDTMEVDRMGFHKILWGLAVRQIQTARTSKKPLNPLFYAYYEKKLSEGKKKKQVIICIMRKLINVIYSMMRNKTEYRMTQIPERTAS